MNIVGSWILKLVVVFFLFSAEGKAKPSRAELIAQVDQAIEKKEYQKAVELVNGITKVPVGRTISVPKWWIPLFFKKGWCELKLKRWKSAAGSFELCHKQLMGDPSNPYHLEALRGWARAEAGLGNHIVSIKLLKRYAQKISPFDWEKPPSIEALEGEKER